MRCSKHGLHIRSYSDGTARLEHGIDLQHSFGSWLTSESFSWMKEETFRSVSSDFAFGTSWPVGSEPNSRGLSYT